MRPDRTVHRSRRAVALVVGAALLAATAAVTGPPPRSVASVGRLVPVRTATLGRPVLAHAALSGPAAPRRHAFDRGELTRHPKEDESGGGLAPAPALPASTLAAPSSSTSTSTRAAQPVTAGPLAGSVSPATTPGAGSVTALRRLTGIDSGLNVSFYGGSYEPGDPVVAASPDYVVEMVNTVGRITPRAGGAAVNLDLGVFFDVNHGGVELTDPRVLWDAASGRWFASAAVYVGATGAAVTLAVSTTADPRGDWRLYTVTSSPTVFHDQPRLALTADKVIMGWDDFQPSNGSYVWDHSALGVVDKAATITGGQPAVGIATDTRRTSGGALVNDWYAITPAVQTVAANRGYAVYNTSFSKVGVLTVDGLPGAGLSVTETGVAFSRTSSPPQAIQPGSTVVDTGDDRFQSAVSDGSRLWLAGNDACTPAGDTSARACLRLVQLGVDTSPRLLQDIDAGLPGTDLYYPAVALDAARNLIAVYSFSSIGDFPSLGVLTQPANGSSLTARTVAAGLGSYTGGRWGDYAAAVADPVDPGSIWVVGQTKETSGSDRFWTTAVAEVTMAAPSVNGLSSNGGAAAGGGTVTLTGQRFVAGATTVSFGGVSGTGVNVTSPETLTVTVPAGPAASVVDVVASTPYGSSTTNSNSKYAYGGTDVRMSASTTTANVVAGNDVSFAATAANAGTLTATNVRITASLTGPATIASATVGGSPCDVTSPAGCSVPAMAGGGSAAVAITAHTTGTGTATVSVTATANEIDPNLSNNTGTAAATVSPATVTPAGAPAGPVAAPAGPAPVPVAAPAPSGPGAGYWFVASDGGIFSFGDRRFLGSTAGLGLSQPIVAMASTPDRGGYWLATRDGRVFAFGSAPFLGSTGALSQPIVGMAPTPSGQGYWLVASDGGIFSFGDAGFFGSTGAIRLNQPIVGMASTPTGRGYWLVARDGGIFAFGDAGFFGSTGAIRLNQPIVGMSSTPTGRGYWFVASDGGIFSFGDAPFHGSTGNIRLNQPIVGMAPTPSGQGYWFVAADGGIFSFGDAPFLGSTGNIHLNKPITGMS